MPNNRLEHQAPAIQHPKPRNIPTPITPEERKIMMPAREEGCLRFDLLRGQDDWGKISQGAIGVGFKVVLGS